MICDADTIGVFQIESRAQMAMLPRLKPRSFYDLVIEVAIVRPGLSRATWSTLSPPAQQRKNRHLPQQGAGGRLGNTLGVPLFQEQAMKVVMVAAGFSAADADRLRRAMAAWKKNGVLETFHDKVVNGMTANGYAREFAEATFNQIRGFGLYGFPESHAASFALLVYASAWSSATTPPPSAPPCSTASPWGFTPRPARPRRPRPRC
jgi:error-prone DNA polymerase